VEKQEANSEINYGNVAQSGEAIERIKKGNFEAESNVGKSMSDRESDY